MTTAAETLVDPALALAALRGAGLALDFVEVTYRRALADGGVAAYRLLGTGLAGQPVETLGYARWAPPERIESILAKWRDGRAEPGPFGDGVRAIPGLSAALFLMPNDRALRLLPRVADLARLKRELAPLPAFEPAGWRIREKKSRLDVIRYKPEHHLVARLALGLSHDASGESRTLDAILRLFTDERGAALHADIAAWRDGGAAAVLPRPLGALGDGQLYLEEAVPGGTLRDAVRAGTTAPEAVVTALATLHGARVRFDRVRPPGSRLASAHAILASLRAAGAIDDAGVAAVAGPLTAALPADRDPRPVHADLHARQVLTGPAGLVFVDLERCALGDPFDDWGSLLAHLLWEGRALLPEGAPAGEFAARLAPLARATAPERPARDLAFYTACALVEIAELPVRRRSPGGEAEARLALRMAREALAPPA